ISGGGELTEFDHYRPIGYVGTAVFYVQWAESDLWYASNVCTLTINSYAPPQVPWASPISDQTAEVGQTATFTIQTSGVPGPSVQWKKNGLAFSGANGLSLVLASVQASDM